MASLYIVFCHAFYEGILLIRDEALGLHFVEDVAK